MEVFKKGPPGRGALAGALSACALVAACGGGGSSEPSPGSQSVGHAATRLEIAQSGIRLQASYANGTLRGHACATGFDVVFVEVSAGGKTVGRGRTDRVGQPQSVCDDRNAHSAFVVDISATDEAALRLNGGLLTVGTENGLYRVQVDLPARNLPAPNVWVTENSSQWLRGVYCEDEGVPHLRGELGQKHLQAVPGAQSSQALGTCKRTREFSLDRASVEAWRYRHGVLAGEQVWLWAGDKLGNSRPVMASNLSRSAVRHGVPVIEAGINGPSAVFEQPWVQVDAPFLFYEFMGLSPYERGLRQGRLAAQLRARGMQAWAGFQPFTPDKLLVEDVGQAIRDFRDGYLEGSAGVAPDGIYMADEPYWTSAGPAQSHSFADVYAMSRALSDAMMLFRQAFPQARLMAAVQPGALFRADLGAPAVSLIAGFDYVAFDPYVAYSTLPPALYDRPVRELRSQGTCPAEEFERVDRYLSRCALEVLQARNPQQRYAWVMQSFLIPDSPLPRSSPVKAHALREHWRSLSGLAYEARGLSMGMVPWGWRLSPEHLVYEPGLVPGQTLQSAWSLQGELVEALGKSN